MLSRIENGTTYSSIKLLSELCDRLRLSISDVLEMSRNHREDGSRWLAFIDDLFACGEFQLVVTQCKSALHLSWARKSDLIRSQILYRIGRAQHRLGKFDVALSFFESALKEQSTSPSLLTSFACEHGIATSLQDLGVLDESVRHYNTGIQMVPSVTDISLKIRFSYNYARLLRQLSDSQKAQKIAFDASFLSRKTQIYPVGGHVEALIGILFMEEGNVSIAREYFNRALGFYIYLGDVESANGVTNNLSMI